MVTQVRCADLMPGCSCTFAIEGKNADELIANAARHAEERHGMATIPPEIARKLRAVVTGA